jgi:hypothetical protein
MDQLKGYEDRCSDIIRSSGEANMAAADRRMELKSGVRWTCVAVVAAQGLALPLAYIIAFLSIGLSSFAMTAGNIGRLCGGLILACGLAAALFVEYLAASLAGHAVSYYWRGMHDLPVKRVARWAVAGLSIGVVALQCLDAWERKLRWLGVEDRIQFGIRTVVFIACVVIGVLAGLRRWVETRRWSISQR